MEFLPNYVMQGRMQAILVASVFALLSIAIPPISVVSLASVALVTLRQGAKEGGYILVCVCLAIVLLSILLAGSYQLPLLYALGLWTPVWLASVVLREGRQLFLAVEIVIFIAAIAVVGAYLYQPDLAQFWAAVFNPSLEPALVKFYPEMPVADIHHALSKFYHFIVTGVVAQTYSFGVLAGLFLGRWWQAILYNPGGFEKEYLTLQGRSGFAITSLVIMATALLSSGLVAEICWNVSILLLLIYALIGIIILHCAFATLKMKRFMLPFLYVTMMLIPHALIPAAILGLADTWLNLRNKIPNQTSV